MHANPPKSKKLSGANSNSKLPEPLVFFLDRSIGKLKVATALRQAGAQVAVHDDHFQPDTRDEDWLTEAGQEGWVVLTKDQRIRYRTIEREALMQAGVRAFVLTAGNIDGTEMAEIFVKALPKIRRFAAKYSPPFIATVSRSGSVSMLAIAR